MSQVAQAADFLEDMSIADYFQAKQDTREMIKKSLAGPLQAAAEKLCSSILHTEHLEEKTGVLNSNDLTKMISDRDLLLELLSKQHLRRTEIRDIIDRMVLQQAVQQESIRQQMEALRKDLMQCKTIIEDFSRQPKIADVDGPSLDSQLIRSKVYQFIANVDSTRREFSDNIAKVRAAIESKSQKAFDDVKSFAETPIKKASSFFSHIKKTAEELKNKLFYAADEIAKSPAAAKKKTVSFLSEALDSSAASLIQLRDYINGNSPEMMEENWNARIQLAKDIKEMVNRGFSEKKIQKTIKSFCSDNNLGASGMKEAQKYLRELVGSKGVTMA